ncbi:MAG TPA: SUMF1/EgtB/PvdO family nonheme iron enzyme [Planctomycetota bacterium]
MSDRKSGPWPLLAISLLVLLLAAFLVVKFRQQGENKPLVVKEPPRPEEPVVVTPPPAPPPPTPPAVEPAAPAQSLGAAELAIKNRRWDEAEKALDALAKTPEVDVLRAKIAAGRKEEEEARKAALAREEALRKRDQAWVVAREKIEKAKNENRWDEATRLLDALLKEFPDLDKVEDVAALRKNVDDLRKDGDGIFKKEMADAEKQFAAGRFAQASTASERAIRWYPERTEAVREFQKKVRVAKVDSEMVRVPDAACWIGHDQNEDEKPFRQVKLPPFFIDRYEVTNEDFQSFVVSTGRPAPPHWGGKSVPRGDERHPVVYVSYEDAEAYAKWAGKRLPTADEWEVAARGPDRREFPWGNAFSEKENVFPCNSLEYWQVAKGAPTTLAVDAPVLANGESAFRVYGMGGNVWEWTSTSAAGKVGQQLLEFRILKGGSFMTSAKALRCANRLSEDPRLRHPDVGFRCARDAK